MLLDDDIPHLFLVTDSNLTTLLRQFDSGTVVKGNRYKQQGRVEELLVVADENGHPGWNVDARVRGNGATYDTQLDLARDEAGHWHFGGRCTCPVGARCKHMVAALAAWSEQHPEMVAAAPPKPASTRRSAAAKAAEAEALTASLDNEVKADGEAADRVAPPREPPEADAAGEAEPQDDMAGDGPVEAADETSDDGDDTPDSGDDSDEAAPAPRASSTLSGAVRTWVKATPPAPTPASTLPYPWSAVEPRVPGAARSAAAAAVVARSAAPSPQDQAANQWLIRVQAAQRHAPPLVAGPAPDLVYFVLSVENERHTPNEARLMLCPAKARKLKSTGRAGVLQNLARNQPVPPGHERDSVLRAVRERLPLMSEPGQSSWIELSYGTLAGPLALPTLELALASGRVVARQPDGSPTEPWVLGGPLQLGWHWVPTQAAKPRLPTLTRGGVVPLPSTESADPLWQLQPQVCDHRGHALSAVPVVGEPAFYVDARRRRVGPLQFNEADADALGRWLAAPPMTERWLRSQPSLRQWLPSLPAAVAPPVSRVVQGRAPVPWLELLGAQAGARNEVAFALWFDYDGERCAPWPPEAAARQFQEGEGGVVEIHRDVVAEQAATLAWAEFATLLSDDAPALMDGSRPPQRWHLGHLPLTRGQPSPRARLSAWLAQDFAPLRALGFEVEMSASWNAQTQRVDDLHAVLGTPEDGGPGWLDLALGFEIAGRQVNLLPLLPQVLSNLKRGAPDAPGTDPNTGLHLPERLWLQGDDGAWLSLPSAPLRPWLTLLMELVGERAGDFKGTSLSLSPMEALRLDVDQADWGGNGHSALREVLAPRQPNATLPDLPEGLAATPRPYQHQGFAWLRALAGRHLGGVLADDMGLGKTLQTLMHLLDEKASGRASHPSLVIAPTSLVGNWRRECERFTPALRLLVLHGVNRHALHASLAEHDVVLTTYPLLHRDLAVLEQQPWHAVVLDEAQALKNTSTQTAQAARRLNANHRIALSGTPMENHLGELWSLFDLVLPGYLGRQTRFAELFRTPIEKHGDGRRMALLRRRLSPFMLRREKSMVASELPPKIEQTVRVSLGSAQANLYETVRAAAETTVQEALAGQGLARSQITVLDALLKLRQVCCHPQLLKLSAARRIHASAKLDWLLDTLPQMLAEGRRVLLFSQFTSMLALIESALAEAGLRWTKLTGGTVDREAAIARFTSGEVPLFLISLKAGGTGLNLPQADTVIHYDPWWNPAVENQATDRAHRLGQTQTVFVYKLVAEGTLEERILAMQARKAELARGVQSAGATPVNESDNPSGGAALDQGDLDFLLQPLADAALADAEEAAPIPGRSSTGRSSNSRPSARSRATGRHKPPSPPHPTPQPNPRSGPRKVTRIPAATAAVDATYSASGNPAGADPRAVPASGPAAAVTPGPGGPGVNHGGPKPGHHHARRRGRGGRPRSGNAAGGGVNEGRGPADNPPRRRKKEPGDAT